MVEAQQRLLDLIDEFEDKRTTAEEFSVYYLRAWKSYLEEEKACTEKDKTRISEDRISSLNARRKKREISETAYLDELSQITGRDEFLAMALTARSSSANFFGDPDPNWESMRANSDGRCSYFSDRQENENGKSRALKGRILRVNELDNGGGF